MDDFATDADCTLSLAFSAEVTDDPNPMVAAFVQRLVCPETSCVVAYAGDLER